MRYSSEDHLLEGHLAVPERVPMSGAPGFIICHGFPTMAIGAARAGQTYYALADRISHAKGAVVLAMHYRGCGGNPGNFSLGGWLRDIEAAIEALHQEPTTSSVSIIGFGTGGALAICAAAVDPRVRAVCAVAPPADFSDWSKNPEVLLGHARDVGAISDPDFPAEFDVWAAELAEVQAAEAAGQLAPRPLMILHGSDDDVVPVFDSRIVADGHGDAELRIVPHGEHLLHRDPRAIALLLGWIDRLRYAPSLS